MSNQEQCLAMKPDGRRLQWRGRAQALLIRSIQIHVTDSKYLRHFFR